MSYKCEFCDVPYLFEGLREILKTKKLICNICAQEQGKYFVREETVRCKDKMNDTQEEQLANVEEEFTCLCCGWIGLKEHSNPGDLCNTCMQEKLLNNPCREIDIPDVSPITGEQTYERLGASVGRLVAEKQKAYGDSFGRSGNCLREMYPDGVRPDQLDDMLVIARILDKLFRIASEPDYGGESPFRDICGYALLGLKKHEDK